MTTKTSDQRGAAWTPEQLRTALQPVLEPVLKPVLEPVRARAARVRCAGKQLLASAASYVLVHTAASTQLASAAAVTPAAAPGTELLSAYELLSACELLSARERELVALVARGYTDAQIARQMFITVRTVSSHLDRIRNKTGCRRRADLTRLAHSAGLV
jgi:DNA-binding CsgD family transcriptional regulator